MRLLLFNIHLAIWIGWFIYWRIAASNVKTEARRDTGFRWAYNFPLLVAGISFWLPRPFPALRVLIFPHRFDCWIVGTVLLVLGMVIAFWARAAIGRNWSNVVTVKVDHELVQHGPYRWVRHPIYSGLLLAVAGSALAQDFWIDVAIVVLVFAGFWIKLQREEQWMREEFGAAYDDYARRTKRLIPFVL